MYWHRLLEEYFNRYAEGVSFHYLPRSEDIIDVPNKLPEGTTQHNIRIELTNGHYLTAREAQCGYWLLQGMTMKSIAAQMELSPRTVEYYLKRMKERLGCHNKKSLMLLLDTAQLPQDIHLFTS